MNSLRSPLLTLSLAALLGAACNNASLLGGKSSASASGNPGGSQCTPVPSPTACNGDDADDNDDDGVATQHHGMGGDDCASPTETPTATATETPEATPTNVSFTDATPAPTATVTPEPTGTPCDPASTTCEAGDDDGDNHDGDSCEQGDDDGDNHDGDNGGSSTGTGEDASAAHATAAFRIR